MQTRRPFWYSQPGGRISEFDIRLHLQNTLVGAYFNAGVRTFRFVDAPIKNAPPVIEETGFYIPAAPANNPTCTIQINHVMVDEKGFIYAIDRASGGLYILKYSGPGKLD